MKVPGLVVLFSTQPVEDGLVVYLDELPFRPVAEVSEKPTSRVEQREADRKFVQKRHSPFGTPARKHFLKTSLIKPTWKNTPVDLK